MLRVSTGTAACQGVTGAVPKPQVPKLWSLAWTCVLQNALGGFSYTGNLRVQLENFVEHGNAKGEIRFGRTVARKTMILRKTRTCAVYYCRVWTFELFTPSFGRFSRLMSDISSSPGIVVSGPVKYCESGSEGPRNAQGRHRIDYVLMVYL